MKKLYVSFEDVQRQVQDIIRQMYTDSWRPDYVVGLTRGGLTPAVLLSQYLDVPMYALHVSLRDFENCETNCWMAEDAFGSVPESDPSGARVDPFHRKNILVVDDINDSGNTINWIKQDWQQSVYDPADGSTWDAVWGKTTRFAVLYDNLASDAIITPTYASEEINKAEDPTWIVFPWEEWWKRWNPDEEVIQ